MAAITDEEMKAIEEVSKMLEIEPPMVETLLLSQTFRPSVNSWRFWFLQAKQRKPTAFSLHKSRLSAWKRKMLNFVITKELSTLVGSLALKCGRLLMVANTALITTKHIDFSPAPSSTVV